VTYLIAALLFLLGGYLAIRTIAALYRVLDLWYAIGREYPRLIGGIVGWGGAIVLVTVLAGQRHRAAFLWGMGAFAAFYLSLYALRNLAMRRPRG
jgi:hypothetical protein